jgi:cyanophycinase-like exopeptidase
MSGRLVVMGSGEIAPSMVATHRRALRAAGTGTVTVVDTPYGFQENADELTSRIADYFRVSLVADVEVARLRGRHGSPAERERFLAITSRAPYLFSGPGSPTYALAAWREVGFDEVLRRRLSEGGTVVMASAAALTVGTRTLPVYEIYKVGEEPRWEPGLDLTSHLGLPMVVVPHWNNAEGGTHDTSRCFVGRRRFDAMAGELEEGVLGVDEHSAATLDFAEGTLMASGAGEVTLVGARTRVLESGEIVGLEEVASILGSAGPAERVSPAPGPPTGFEQALAAGDVGAVLEAILASEEAAAAGSGEDRARLRRMLTELAERSHAGLGDPRARVAGYVDLLLDLRERARSDHRWDEADAIRNGLGTLGVEVRDTPGGPEWDLA